jgi:hypothetical protein
VWSFLGGGVGKPRQNGKHAKLFSTIKHQLTYNKVEEMKGINESKLFYQGWLLVPP